MGPAHWEEVLPAVGLLHLHVGPIGDHGGLLPVLLQKGDGHQVAANLLALESPADRPVPHMPAESPGVHGRPALEQKWRHASCASQPSTS